MFHYEKKLQYPVKIRRTNPKLAKVIITQYGGPDTVKYNDVFTTKKALHFKENEGFYL